MYPLRILVIDDHPEHAEILKTMITAQGREIQTCTRGQEAVDLIHKEKFDLVFTDMIMPDIHGVQIMEEIKKSAPETEVVPVTAFGDWGLYAETLKLGAKEFINKPFNVSEVQGIVKRVASSKK
jgi:two-component system response regulator PilR (NtrC family)